MKIQLDDMAAIFSRFTRHRNFGSADKDELDETFTTTFGDVLFLKSLYNEDGDKRTYYITDEDGEVILGKDYNKIELVL